MHLNNVFLCCCLIFSVLCFGWGSHYIALDDMGPHYVNQPVMFHNSKIKEAQVCSLRYNLPAPHH